MADHQDTNKIGNEISVIRDILMGEHISKYNQNFENLDEALAKKEADLNNKLQELDKRVEEHFSRLENDINERFDALNTLLNGKVEELGTRIAKESSSNKKRIGALMKTVSEALLGEEDE